jgi:hypothetical protein
VLAGYEMVLLTIGDVSLVAVLGGGVWTLLTCLKEVD